MARPVELRGRYRLVLVFWSDQHRGQQIEAGEAEGFERPIPRKGELIDGPDDFGLFRVESVTYDYGRGVYYPPTVYVRCVKPSRGDR